MKIHDIESTKNPIFRDLTSLLTGSGINEAGKALIFGKKAIEAVVHAQRHAVEALIVSKDLEPDPELKIDMVYRLSNPLFKELDVFGTHTAILIVKVPKFNKVQSRLTGCTLLLMLQDPSNLGGLLRTAAGFGVNQIILGPGSAHPFHPKSSRASSGTLFLHTYFQIKTVSELEVLELPLLALDMNGVSLKNYNFPKDFILMPGQEGKGLTDSEKSMAAEMISIPLSREVESLNAVVATSIALYEWKTS